MALSKVDTPQPPAFELYNGSAQHENFCRLKELFPHSILKPASNPAVAGIGTPLPLPDQFNFEGEKRSADAFLKETDTSALLVLQNGEVRYESYFLTGGSDVQWISWSVAKSFVSALVGIAIADGHIRSVDDAISSYVPTLIGSAYEGVRIEDVLQMSSGARWSEDYSDPNAEVHRLSNVMAGQMDLETFVAGIQRDATPGTICQYNSADTQALGLLLTRATGRSVTDYMQEKLFDPLGMEAQGYWLLDSSDMELTLGGLNLTARDFAKVGELYRNNGRLNGKQIVPEEWVRRSVAPGKPHLKPGKVIVGGHVFPFGYGYQWWIPAGDRGEFSAIGVYNQFVFVDPSRDMTIVKLSSNRAYGTTPDEATNREAETVEFLRAVAAAAD
ncbi:MAG: serine hydrolase [Rhodobiaceae bacterium]|nr:serine hydrolase [Rhodobiaceae bacterium]